MVETRGQLVLTQKTITSPLAALNIASYIHLIGTILSHQYWFVISPRRGWDLGLCDVGFCNRRVVEDVHL